jgi:ADP-ribose pyrophosphatase YjhB (NUDIX family)
MRALTPLFRAWWRINRAMTLGVRGLVEDREGRILLVRHTYVEGWHFPGGGVERNETAVEALIRELAEEGAVRPTGPLELLGFFSNAHAFPNDHVLFYRATTWEKHESPLNSREIAEFGFFSRDGLPEGASRATRRRLAELYGGTAPSPFWTPRDEDEQTARRRSSRPYSPGP